MPDLILIARVEQLTILFLELLHLLSFMYLYSPKDRGNWRERNVPSLIPSMHTCLPVCFLRKQKFAVMNGFYWLFCMLKCS